MLQAFLTTTHHPRQKTLAHYTHQLQISHQAFGSFGTDINYSKGQRYLGGFIGSAVKKGVAGRDSGEVDGCHGDPQHCC
jgi:hypothetical protein